MRHTRQGVALALSSATPRLISSDSEREPSVSVGRSPSTGIGEGHILQTQVVGRGASPSGLVLGLDPGSKTTGWGRKPYRAQPVDVRKTLYPFQG